MGLSVCPAAVVAAPVERVWSLLTEPEAYGEWIDGRVDGIEPPGPAQPGQVIVASDTAFGRRWFVRLTVEDVDPEGHQIRFDVKLPLGVGERTHIACAPIDETTCRVQFG